MIRSLRRRTRRGVTLLEVTLAMSLLIVLSSMTYWFYGSVLETSRTDTDRARDLRLVRVVLDRIATEIRQSSTISASGSIGLVGDKERIGLTTLRVPSREITRSRRSRETAAATEFDLVTVEYKIARHPEVLHEDGWEYPLGLARVERLIPRPVQPGLVAPPESEGRDDGAGDDGSGDDGTERAGEGDFGTDESPFDVAHEGLFGDDANAGREVGVGPDIQWEELYAPEIRHLRFCYYDGHSWWDDWTVQGENPLPQLVMITVGFDVHPPCGEEFGLETKDNEEFCECLNRDPPDCAPLPKDQYTTVVRVTQADPLFRSRITRETQSLMQQLGGGEEAQP